MYNILIVEDAIDYQKIISQLLNEYHVTCVDSAEEASLQLRNKKFDIILIDINLPGRDGYSLITEIQSDNELKEIPIFCLTGRIQVTDKVTAFSLGADDYITKPFNVIEFKARVEVKLKKTLRRKMDERKVIVGDIEIDHSRHRVCINNSQKKEEINITPTEFKILNCFVRGLEQVFTRDQLLIAAWGDDATVLDRVIDAHICSIRKKIKNSRYGIKSVKGFGYKLEKK